MKVGGLILILGIFVAVFAAVIPFIDYWEEIEDIIYFRGILFGLFLICIGSAATLKNYYQNAVISLGSGVLALLIMSTLNLLIDDIIDTYNYFKLTFIITVLSFTVITILRLCWKRVYQRFKY